MTFAGGVGVAGVGPAANSESGFEIDFPGQKCLCYGVAVGVYGGLSVSGGVSYDKGDFCPETTETYSIMMSASDFSASVDVKDGSVTEGGVPRVYSEQGKLWNF